MTPEQAKALREPFPESVVGKPCLVWTGAKDRRGYGRVFHEGRITGAHQRAYIVAYGPVPDGLEIDHLCMNPACCEPTHLEAVTHQENMRRAAAAGLLGTGQGRKTHCPQNHPYDESNTYRWRNERQCRTCRNETTRRLRAARKAVAM